MNVTENTNTETHSTPTSLSVPLGGDGKAASLANTSVDEVAAQKLEYGVKEGEDSRRNSFVADPQLEKRLLRKLDRNLMPIISIMFMLSFLDRANIGNAFAAGMIKDLKLLGLKANIASAVFFITYSTFEVPANMLLKVIRPSIWIPSMMLAWGTVLTLMSLVKTYEGLVIGRIFLGVAETGMFPGALFYTSLWYPRKAQAFRVSIFYSTAVTGVAFGGILAYGIEQMEGVANLHGWAWLFCIEGLVTVVMAVVAFFTIQDHPKNARFLTQAEKDYLTARLQQDQKGASTKFAWKFVWQAFTDLQTWLQMLIYLGILVPIYALSLFLPTIITNLGFSRAVAQLLTVPPYMLAFPLAIYSSYLSDKYMIRGPFIIFYLLFGIAGFAILLGTTSAGAGYAGAILATIGCVSPAPVALAWQGNNMAGDLKRGVGFALIMMWCNYFGIVAAFTYRVSQAPRFRTGHTIAMAFMCTSVLFILITMFRYHRINKKREERCKREGIDATREAEFTEIGDKSPLFRYTL